MSSRSPAGPRPLPRARRQGRRRDRRRSWRLRWHPAGRAQSAAGQSLPCAERLPAAAGAGRGRPRPGERGGLRQAARQLGIHRDALRAAFQQWGLPALERRVGWQPSRFLADRGEAERAFALAERLGSVNAAAAELGTTWPSLRKAFTRHGLGMPARNPETVRERAIEAARQRSGRSRRAWTRCCSAHHGGLPVRARSGGELAERVRRAEDYALLGAGGGGAAQRKPRRQAQHPSVGDHPPRSARPPPPGRPRAARRASPGRPQ
jgi:hypothetical protein